MLNEQVNKDYVAAMKARDTIRSSTLSFLRAQLKNVMIDNKLDQLDDAQVLAVIRKQVKQRKDSIEQFINAGRQDLVDKEQAEWDVLKAYLPAEMDDAALDAIVREVIQALGAQSMKDMGRVMKDVVERTAGQADNKRISDCVKNMLTG
ncbi:MAG: GatB/YqeY domain-containing protein [Candidatus Omnitrophica bacterium]|nr:GatB/YqeY domain-containing protein [Candidatus Omnitrophota bacterium]